MNEANLNLRERWLSLVEPFSVGPKFARVIFKEIAGKYSEPGRFYHTLQHINYVLDIIDKYKDCATDLPAVQLAAWFHDVIYEAREKDNEEKSAEYATKTLSELGLPSQLIEETARLILLTKTHRTTTEDTNGLLMLDADLAILGASPETYQEYCEGIRQEYAWVPDETYRGGRRKVLENFLQRPRLYQLAAIRDTIEGQARLNLQNEINSLA